LPRRAARKIRNPHYTQKLGRDDLFVRPEKKKAAAVGWDSCDAACEGHQ
jgi:hypothetical protein